MHLYLAQQQLQGPGKEEGNSRSYDELRAMCC